MSFHSLASLLPALLLVLTPASGNFAQSMPVLPSGMLLSTNGCFVTGDIPGSMMVSRNGAYTLHYRILDAGDEIRKLEIAQMYHGNERMYSRLPIDGSDIMLSNRGDLAVFDTRFHDMGRLDIVMYSVMGEKRWSHTFFHAALFDFSSDARYFAVNSEEGCQVFDVDNGHIAGRFPACRLFAFSTSGHTLVTLSGEKFHIYHNLALHADAHIQSGIVRRIAVNSDGTRIACIEKNQLLLFDGDGKQIHRHTLGSDLAFRDLRFENGLLYAGVQRKAPGRSTGFLYTFREDGSLTDIQEGSSKTFAHHNPPPDARTHQGGIQTIPWPFVPFNGMHTVWNYYEQHMGNGYDTWSYLHQGLDIITPVGEPCYAVEAGIVKCVLTTGGQAYWRVAVSPVQTPDTSEGWLYAHLDPGTIQVEVGDTVQIHDYLGDIIQWSTNWGHLHFVKIRDHGLVWAYDDGEWGILFNPLLALSPNSDTIAPLIEPFAAGSMLGLHRHGSNGVFLDPANVSGDIEIIARISDYHGLSAWTLPAYQTYYGMKRLSDQQWVIPRTLGQQLNHAYPFYAATQYEAYAPLLYYKDSLRLPPPWMSLIREYYHVLTRNNGDTLLELNELNLFIPTASYVDGNYRIYIEAWDECGNMNMDSMDVYLNNGNSTGIRSNISYSTTWTISPNPARGITWISGLSGGLGQTGFLQLYDAQYNLIRTIRFNAAESEGQRIPLHLDNLAPGLYFLRAQQGGLLKLLIIK